MKNEQRQQIVETLYKKNARRTDCGLDDMIITEALSVATESCADKDDFFRVLSALNLLNAAIKDKRWKQQLSYAFIKGHVSNLFNQWIANPVDGVKGYYSEQERAVLFNVDGVIFSYHSIGLTERIRSFIHSERNVPIEWAGVRLQKIPVELFDMAMSP